jgi:hypothetical protein
MHDVSGVGTTPIMAAILPFCILAYVLNINYHIKRHDPILSVTTLGSGKE